MTKRLFHYLLLAAMVCSLGLSVTACKDDDDEKKSEEQREEEQMEQATAFWNVVGQLTFVDNYTPDYADKTFEPSIGEPSEQNPYIRIVGTGDMATAAMRFANLIGAEDKIDENTATYEWKDDAVGTLTYHKTTDGTSLATVDVSIRQMPHLQQIVYQTPEQSGDNGSFNGNAYYRFGDVVKRTYQDADNNNKQMEEYWICVRPAFGPQKKETSHWITLSPLPKKHIFDYPYGDRHYAVPTGLGTSKEHMENFAEMLYAITYPHEWHVAIDQRKRTIKMFHDFYTDSVKYHNEFFWRKVQRAWTEQDIWKKIFGSFDNKQTVEQRLSQGLHLLYHGYSWWTKLSWNLTLYEAIYRNGTNDEQNMHNYYYHDVKKSVENLQSVNVNTCTPNSPAFISDFFTDRETPRYIVRYATGKDLLGVKPNVHASIERNSGGITIEDVYTYNKTYGITVNNYGRPEVAEAALNAPQLGCVLAKNGKFYENKDDAYNDHATPVAVVVYLGKKSVEKGTRFSGLAMSTEDLVANTVAWSKDADSFGYCCTTSNRTEQFRDIRDGIMKSVSMENGCGKSHNHPAYKVLEGETKMDAGTVNFSEWFLPSVGQWILALEGMGLTWDGATSFTTQGNAYNKIRTFLARSGFQSTAPNGTYWMTLQSNEKFAYTIDLVPDTVKFDEGFLTAKNTSNRARAFIAFGNDATYEEPVSGPTARVGQLLGANGKFYDSKALAQADGTQPLALVLYYDADHQVEANADYHGLAIALNDVKSASNEFSMSWSTDRGYPNCATVIDNTEQMANALDGIAMSNKLRKLRCNPGHGHPAFTQLPANDPDLMRAGFSEWFVPSTGQWIMAMQGIGLTWTGNKDMYFGPQGVNQWAMLKALFTKAGVEDDMPIGYYWSSTEASEWDDTAYVISLNDDNRLNFDVIKRYAKDQGCMRPFIAF